VESLSLSAGWSAWSVADSAGALPMWLSINVSNYHLSVVGPYSVTIER
jgi:hypothetical protein